MIADWLLKRQTVVAGFDDVAVVGQPIEQRGRWSPAPNTLGHSPKARLVVTIAEVLVSELDEVE